MILKLFTYLLKLLVYWHIIKSIWHTIAIYTAFSPCYNNHAQNNACPQGAKRHPRPQVFFCAKNAPVRPFAAGTHHIYKEENREKRTQNQIREKPSRKKETLSVPGQAPYGCIRLSVRICALHAAGLCNQHVDEGRGHPKGCLYQDSRHFHHSGHRLRIRRPASDELQQVRQDRGRIPRVVKADCHHLGDPERPRLHHGLCHTVFQRRQVDGLTGGTGKWEYLTAS